jgi:hypothetical protein
MVKSNPKTALVGSFCISTPSPAWWCPVVEELPKKINPDANTGVVGLRFAQKRRLAKKSGSAPSRSPRSRKPTKA